MTMNTTDQAQTPEQIRAETIATFRDELDKNIRGLEAFKRSVNRESWVIICETLPLKFEVNARGIITKVRTGTLYSATRLTQAEAQRIAPDVRNGRGTQGEAVEYGAAAEKEIAHLRDMIAKLEAQAARLATK